MSAVARKRRHVLIIAAVPLCTALLLFAWLRPTCVPPHSSREKPMSSTRTSSPYFSPNSAIAPPLTASS